jgi:hypothetical protein
MTATSSRIEIPDFAGVALVDILANGVATLIIIIAISISARTEQESQVLDQIAETATVLSREFSENLVINKLSGNAPARLHDYERSPIDQYLDVRVMPIFELHQDAVRNYFSGDLYRREELLQQQTRLDRVLEGMQPQQKRRIRIDIYDVQQFYVFQSILRSHEIEVRHWHFLKGTGANANDLMNCPPGVAAKDCVGGLHGSAIAGKNQETGTGQNADEQLSDLIGSLKKGDEDQGSGGAGTSSEEAGKEDAEALANALAQANAEDGAPEYTQSMPENVDMGGFSGGPDGEGRYQGQGSAARSGQSGRRGSRGGNNDGRRNRPVTDLYQQNGQVRPSSMRMRLAAPDVPTPGRPADKKQKGADDKLRELLARKSAAVQDMRLVLAALLDYCREGQELFDTGKSPWHFFANFKKGLAERLEKADALTPDEEAMLNPLVEQLNAYWPDQTPPLVRSVFSSEFNGLALSLPVNAGITEAVVVGDQWQRFPPNLPKEAYLNVNFNLHPSLHKGISQELQSYGILLVPPEQIQKDAFRWRAMVYISPSFDDFIIGFLYAAFSEDGRILLHPESNAVEINNSRLRTQYPPVTITTHGWVRMLYTGLIAALLLLMWPAYRIWFKVQLARRAGKRRASIA